MFSEDCDIPDTITWACGIKTSKW